MSQRDSQDVRDFAELIKGCSLSSHRGNVRFVLAEEAGLRPLSRSQRFAIARFVASQHKLGIGDGRMAGPLLARFGELDQGGGQASELDEAALLWEVTASETSTPQPAPRAARQAPVQAAADNTDEKSEQSRKKQSVNTAELAPLSTDWETHSLGMFGYLPNPDPVNEQYTSKHGSYQYELGIYEKMYDSYWHLRSVLQQKWGAVISFPRRLEPADESEKAREIRDIVEGLIERISRFQADLREMGLNADLYGFSVHEAITAYKQGWRIPDTDERRDSVCIERLASRRSGRFVFGLEGELRLLTQRNNREGEEMPERTFVVHRNQTRWDNPYGDGLGKAAYFAFLLVSRTLRYWAQFNERFGAPTVVLFYPDDATSRDRAAYRSLVTGFMQNAGFTVPRKDKDELEIKLLEPQRYGTLNVYRELLDYCNAEMSKLVLGQTMTTEDGSSLSQSEVHYQVRQDILEDAAAALAETLSDSVVRWLVDWNFSAEEHQDLYPRFVIDSSPPEDVVTNQQVLSQALLDGVPLVADEYYEKTRLTKPEQYQELEVIEPPEPESSDPFGLDFPAAARGRSSGRAGSPLSTQSRRDAELNSDPPSERPRELESKHKVARQPVSVPATAAATATAPVLAAGRDIAPCSVAMQRASLELTTRQADNPDLARYAERELLRLNAEAAELLPAEELRRLFGEGVSAASASLDYLPGLISEHFLRTATAALGEDAAGQPLDEAAVVSLNGWEQDWQADEERTQEFIDRLNDDLTIAGLLGWERMLEFADAENIDTEIDESADVAAAAGGNYRWDPSLRAFSLNAAAEDELINPNVQVLFGHERIIPSRVLSVLNRRVRQSVSYETFYKLDALGRSAAFTAWDLALGDIRHIGGALQDATRWGYTVQQFADYLHERLQARYVIQEGEGLHAWHIESIYGHNLADAWNTENMDALYELREDFPYVLFQNPSPQHPVCVEMDGRVWPVDDAVWRSYKPPLHWGCGSTIVAVTQARMEAEGLSAQTAPPVEQPDSYSGPRDPQTGERVGRPAPFGAWAPLEERYAALERQLQELDNA